MVYIGEEKTMQLLSLFKKKENAMFGTFNEREEEERTRS
jgi:hypothetical protein